MATIFSCSRWRFKNTRTAVSFSLPMAVAFLSQVGVSGVRKMTRYKDGGLLGKFFLTV
jgi:hypothetical protein